MGPSALVRWALSRSRAAQPGSDSQHLIRLGTGEAEGEAEPLGAQRGEAAPGRGATLQGLEPLVGAEGPRSGTLFQAPG